MVSLEWTKHLKTEKERKEFQELLLSSNKILGRLIEILEERENVLTREEISPENYDQGYAFRQAYQNGRRYELTKLKQLITFEGRP